MIIADIKNAEEEYNSFLKLKRCQKKKEYFDNQVARHSDDPQEKNEVARPQLVRLSEENKIDIINNKHVSCIAA